jgi:S-methylmethionine-dependent homocysteine/selenocysteine methylase
MGADWEIALRAAVRLAQQAVPDGHTVIGSIAPVEDCYRPERSPGAAARDEHRRVARALADAGCDLLLCETFSTEPEARVAVEEALETGLPVWLSLTAGPFGTLHSPASLARLAARLATTGVARLLVNCVAATRIEPYIRAMGSQGPPFGAYANAGGHEEGFGWGAVPERAARKYATLAKRWVDAGATVVGGCCGTGPAHVRALAEAFG